jgi:hypothetical protein
MAPIFLAVLDPRNQLARSRFFIGFRPIVCGLLLVQWVCYATLTFCVCEKKQWNKKKLATVINSTLITPTKVMNSA